MGSVAVCPLGIWACTVVKEWPEFYAACVREEVFVLTWGDDLW